MKTIAAVLREGSGPFSVEELDVAQPGQGEVAISTTAAPARHATKVGCRTASTSATTTWRVVGLTAPRSSPTRTVSGSVCGDQTRAALRLTVTRLIGAWDLM